MGALGFRYCYQGIMKVDYTCMSLSLCMLPRLIVCRDWGSPDLGRCLLDKEHVRVMCLALNQGLCFRISPQSSLS